MLPGHPLPPKKQRCVEKELCIGMEARGSCCNSYWEAFCGCDRRSLLKPEEFPGTNSVLIYEEVAGLFFGVPKDSHT